MIERAPSQHRALMVDDEPLVRQATMRALSRAGFICDVAVNGKEALEMARQTCYALIVTDLRMPETNGHSLAVEILSWPQRPALIVLTGILEPKLAKDLTARGVEAFFFKPVNYQQFAAKAKHIAELHCAKQALDPLLETSAASSAPPHQEFEYVSENDNPHSLHRRLSDLTKQMVLPDTNYDAFRRMSQNRIGSEEVVIALKLDPMMVNQIMRLVNHSIYNFDQRIQGLEESVGQGNQRSKKTRIFAAGMLAGWLLSSLCLAMWLIMP